MNTEYLTDIIILLSAAVITVPLFQALKVGAIPGFIVAGLVLGPSGLGYIENNEVITHLADLGVVLLLFIIGVEINPSRLWNMRGLVLGLGSLQVLITGGAISLAVHLFFDFGWDVSLLIGLALSLSSTAFVLQLLIERKMLSSDYGKPSVSVLLFQDLAVVPLLVFVSLTASPDLNAAEGVFLAIGEAVAIIVFVIVAARYVLNPLLHRLARFSSPEIFTASALLLVLGTAQIMENIGLSMAMGAFIAGLLIADSSYRHQIVAEIQPFRGLLLGLFFMAMGMILNLDIFFGNAILFVLAATVLIFIKVLILWPLSRMFGIGSKSSLSVALLLAQSGEFALVLFAMANNLDLLTEGVFQQLLIVVMLSMLVTPVLEKLAHRHYVSSHSGAAALPEFDTKGQGRTPVILAGFGRMGRRVASILEIMAVPYVAIDNNASIVERERSRGQPIYFGDAQRPEVFRALGAADSPFVIVSIDDLKAAENVVSTLNTAFPDLEVFARAHDLARCAELQEFGAYFTVSETLEASAELARAALLHLDLDAQEVEAAVTQFRKDYYAQINSSAPENLTTL